MAKEGIVAGAEDAAVTYLALAIEVCSPTASWERGVFFNAEGEFQLAEPVQDDANYFSFILESTTWTTWFALPLA